MVEMGLDPLDICQIVVGSGIKCFCGWASRQVLISKESKFWHFLVNGINKRDVVVWKFFSIVWCECCFLFF